MLYILLVGRHGVGAWRGVPFVGRSNSLHADVAVVYKFIHIASSRFRFCVHLHVTSCWLVQLLQDFYLYQTGKYYQVRRGALAWSHWCKGGSRNFQASKQCTVSPNPSKPQNVVDTKGKPSYASLGQRAIAGVIVVNDSQRK